MNAYNAMLARIIDLLYLADLESAKLIYEVFDETVSITSNQPDFKSRWIQLDDSYHLTYEEFRKAIMSAVDIIHQNIVADKMVLVHCHAGINRSCSVIVAYLVLKRRFSVEEAIRFIKDCKRSSCNLQELPFFDSISEFDDIVADLKIWSTLDNIVFRDYLHRLEKSSMV